MNDKKTGGAAFPVASPGGSTLNQGMTLRDHFAGQALAAALANEGTAAMSYAERADFCYRQADAMLTAREAT